MPKKKPKKRNNFPNAPENYQTLLKRSINAIISKMDCQNHLLELKKSYVNYFEHLSQNLLIDAYEELKSSLNTIREIMNEQSSLNWKSQTSSEKIAIVKINESIAKFLFELALFIYKKILTNLSEANYLKIYHDSSSFVLMFVYMNRIHFQEISENLDENHHIQLIDDSINFIQFALQEMQKQDLPYIFEWQPVEDHLIFTLEKALAIQKKNSNASLVIDKLDQLKSFLHFLKQLKNSFNGELLSSQTRLSSIEESIDHYRQELVEKLSNPKKSSKKKKSKKRINPITDHNSEDYFDCQSYPDLSADILADIRHKKAELEARKTSLQDDEEEYFDAIDKPYAETLAVCAQIIIDQPNAEALPTCTQSIIDPVDDTITSGDIFSTEEVIDDTLNSQLSAFDSPLSLSDSESPSIPNQITSTPCVGYDSEDSGHTSHDNDDSDKVVFPETFFQWNALPHCIQDPQCAEVLQRLARIAKNANKECYLFGSGIYKKHPNDLDFLLHENDIEFIALLIAQGARQISHYNKLNRHVVQLEWLGVKLDINISRKAWHEHAQQLDFTIGAAYFNVGTQTCHTRHVDTLDHIDKKELHCAQPEGSLAMLRQDPCILFRAMRLERHEGYRWPEEFTKAVETLAHQETSPFALENHDKLYQEMLKLFKQGNACANLERLIQLDVFEALFGCMKPLNPTQKTQAYALIRQAAWFCDQGGQADSLMYYAIHWPWSASDNNALTHSKPLIRLQQGPFPALNQTIHNHNSRLLQQCAYAYLQSYHLTQPPCSNHRLIHTFQKSPFNDSDPIHQAHQQKPNQQLRVDSYVQTNKA